MMTSCNGYWMEKREFVGMFLLDVAADGVFRSRSWAREVAWHNH